MSSPVMHVREATLDDVGAIAEAHVASWRSTYRGIFPDAVLDGLSLEGRAEMWRGVPTIELLRLADGTYPIAVDWRRREPSSEPGSDRPALFGRRAARLDCPGGDR